MCCIEKDNDFYHFWYNDGKNWWGPLEKNTKIREPTLYLKIDHTLNDEILFY